MQKLYTPREVAELLKLRVNTVYQYIRMGKLPAAKFGNRYRITREDLGRFIEENKTIRRESAEKAKQVELLRLF